MGNSALFLYRVPAGGVQVIGVYSSVRMHRSHTHAQQQKKTGGFFFTAGYAASVHFATSLVQESVLWTRTEGELLDSTRIVPQIVRVVKRQAQCFVLSF